MTKRKKIVLIFILSLVALFLLFIGYHYVKYLQATSRMKGLSADLEKRITEWEKKEYKRQPLFGPVVKGNAAEFYQEAETKLDYTSDNGWMEVSAAIYNPSQPISPVGQAFYESNIHLIEIVRKGTRSETYKSPINLRDGFKSKIPNLIKPMIIGNLMVLQSRELCNTGQISEAIKELCDIIQFGDDYLHYGSLIPAMISIGIADKGHEEIQRFLVSDKLTEEQFTELMGYLKFLIDSHPTMDDSWDGEIALVTSGLKDWSKDSGFIFCKDLFSLHPKDSIWNKIKLLFAKGWINRTDIVGAWSDCITLGAEIKRIGALPYPRAKNEGDKFENTVKQLDNPVSRMMLHSLMTGNSAYLQAPTIRKGLYILTALQIYKIRRGAYPETLSALAPGIIPEVPLDPFSNKPFIYRLDKDKKPILYSVWYNLKDDNGEKQDNRYEDLLITPFLRYGEKK
ncbi:MAG: hypothetical protein HZA49_00330 [Planctomycetes bacterium]|nr:hypothetical protein [Planctomycetota bacterium]